MLGGRWTKSRGRARIQAPTSPAAWVAGDSAQRAAVVVAVLAARPHRRSCHRWPRTRLARRRAVCSAAGHSVGSAASHTLGRPACAAWHLAGDVHPLWAPPGTPAVPARPAQEARRGQATLVEPPHAAGEAPHRPAAGAASSPPAAAPADEVTTFRIGRIIRRTPLPVWILVVLYILTLACWSFLVPVFSAVNEPAAVDGVMRIHAGSRLAERPSNLLPQAGGGGGPHRLRQHPAACPEQPGPAVGAAAR